MLRKEERLSGARVKKTPEREASWDVAHQKCEKDSRSGASRIGD